ncbi:MAG TPA: right-handed parallel beta-helix repeat-containing protein [Xanthobacteraceae bacterium]|jgi:hypothetical protein|nr:right-handed parallel beta-helix repeat-containing protein [Xanthobacteraceae bacterium]
MISTKLASIGLAASLVAILPAVSAHAQAPRTFVSAAGTDNSTCSFAAPCRHFQAAVDATSAGGEVDALDPAGYGPIIIHQAITIEGQGWSYIAPPAGGDGISISAVNGRVAIHGVLLNGVGITPASGIVFNSGSSLNVQDCVIQNFSGTGILFQPNTSSVSKMSVANTRISDSNFGLTISPTGTGTTRSILNHIDIENNIQDGITTSTSSQELYVTVNESVSANNGGAGIISTTTNSGGIHVYVRNSTINDNAGTALSANGQNNFVVVTRSMIADNGLDFTGGLFTYGDNNILVNGDGGGSLSQIAPE